MDFRRKKDLYKHFNRFHSENPKNKCIYWQIIFDSRSALSEHVINDHENWRYACLIWTKKELKNLKSGIRHVKLCHKELIRTTADYNNAYLLLNKLRSKDDSENSNIDMNISREQNDTVKDIEKI